MPRPRFHKLEAKRRAAILEIAAEEIAENGFERASYNRIIERAGLSKGAMYYYFDDKGDLYATVLRHLFKLDQANSDWMSTLPNRPAAFWQWVVDFFRAQAVFSLANPIVAAVARDFAKRSVHVTELPAVAELYADLDRLLETVVVHGQRIKAVRNDLPNSLLVGVTIGAGEAMDRWFVDRFDELTPHELDRILIAAVDLLKRMLIPSGEEKEND